MMKKIIILVFFLLLPYSENILAGEDRKSVEENFEKLLLTGNCNSCYLDKINLEGADLRNSENYYSKCISLPMYPTLTRGEQEFVIEEILKFVKN